MRQENRKRKILRESKKVYEDKTEEDAIFFYKTRYKIHTQTHTNPFPLRASIDNVRGICATY